MTEILHNHNSAASQLASAADKLWFDSHPDRHHRLRQALADELPRVTSDHVVVIRQIVRGLRVRWPFKPWAPLPLGEAPEWMACELFEKFAKYRGWHIPVLADSTN